MVYSALSDDISTVSQFTRRGDIIITTTGASVPASYQVKLAITHEPEMQADFDDIRFNTRAGAYIDYWIESYIASTSAVVWIELPDAITDPGFDIILMYYGNNEMSDGGNIEDTMIFGDNFNGIVDDLDTTNRWTRVDGTTMGADGSGSLYLYGASGTRDKIRGKIACPFPCIVETRYKKENVITNGGQHFIGIEDSTGVDTLAMSTAPTPVSNVYLYREDGGTQSTDSDVLSNTIINFNKYKLEFYTGPVAKWYQNDVLFNTYSDANVPNGDLTMYPYIREAGLNEDGWIDWVFVRKYITNEPTPSYGTAQHQRRTPQFIG